MEKIRCKIRDINESGLFHDSRGDIKKLSYVCNELIEKVNDLIDENESLKERLSNAESKLPKYYGGKI